MRTTVVLFLFLLGCFSCKEGSQKETFTVNEIASPAAENSALPFLSSNGKNAFMSWVETKNDSLAQLRYSEFSEGQWQPSQIIVEGGDWFVNWADFPSIVEQNGNLISHVLKKSTEGTYSYDVKLNLLPKGESTWKTNVPLHSDGTPTEHGFVSTLPYKDGFFITWLDGRNTAEDENGNRGAMTIRAAQVSATGEVSNEIELDSRVCDCCQTTAVITANGPVVMYRDRSEDEVRDMSMVRFVHGKWTAPKTVYADNWKIKGCPVNGPKASTYSNSLAMAWFTAAQANPKVQLLFSADGGANFDAPIQIAEAKVLGRVDILLIDAETALVSWMETVDKKAQLKVARVSRKGAISAHQVIATLDASRKTGFPQMELVGDTVHFAWTDVSKSTSRVQTAFVAVDQF